MSGRRVEIEDVEEDGADAEACSFPDLARSTRPSPPVTTIEQDVGDPQSLVWSASDGYRHHQLAHPRLNPVQSLSAPWVDRDVNLVVAASTSCGKSLIGEMMMGEGLSRNGKVAYLSPLRAVSQERYDGWTSADHPWSARRVEILTGDYRLTAARRRALSGAEVVVMTSETLDSMTRRFSKNRFLADVSCLVVDEAHLLTVPGRGDALEAGVMRFTFRNPRARIVFLSATMPNTHELGGWLHALTGRPTVVIRSAWRPTKLVVWWPTYKEGGQYAANEVSKRTAALGIVKRFLGDKFLIFVHSKKAGWAMVDAVKRANQDRKVEFHCADLLREDRLSLESRFRGGDLDIVVATSTLAMGVNLPARRVILLGVHRGMQEIDPIDVHQMTGRAGRMGLDPSGDAYVLLPDRRAPILRPRFERLGPIQSRLGEEDALAFHLTAEVAEGAVETEEGAVAWHARSFAAFRGKALPERGPDLAPAGTHERWMQISRGEADVVSASGVLQKLAKVGILSVEEDPRTYSATQLGKVASWLYFSPFDIADWASNLRRVVQRGQERNDDALAWALGQVKTAYDQWIPKEVEPLAVEMNARLRSRGFDVTRLTAATLAWRSALRGVELSAIASVQRGLKHDLDRILGAVDLIDRRVLRMLGEEHVELLGHRLRHGVGWEAAALCRLPGVGGKRASNLVRYGVKSIRDVVERKDRVAKAIGPKMAEKIIAAAVEMLVD